MNSAFVLTLLSLQASLVAQSPIRKTLAYSRTTISGIPNDSTFPPSYFIYVIVQRGTAISLTGVCVRGNRHDAELRRIDSPVVTAHDPNVRTEKTDTLVPRTSHDVYQVDVGEPKGPCGNDHPSELVQQNEVVLCLKASGSSWYGLVPKIVALPHAAAM